MLKKFLGVSVAVMAVAGLLVVGACEDDENGNGNGGTDPQPECSADITEIQVLAPTATDTLRVSQGFEVKWCLPQLGANTITQAQIDFSNNEGETWTTLNPDGASVNWPQNTFTFTPNAGQTGNSCIIRVGEYSNVDATGRYSDSFVVLAQ